MRRYLFRRLDAQQIRDKSGFREIDFGCLDEALPEIAVLRPQNPDDILSFEKREPFLQSRCGYAHVACERFDVE